MRHLQRIGFVVIALAVAHLRAWANDEGRLTLNSCLRAALDHNPDLEAAERRIAAARAMRAKARAAWWPFLSTSATYARTDNPPQAFMMNLNQRALNMMSPSFNPNDPDETDNVRLTLGMKYRLFDFGERSAHNEGAREMVAMREAMARATRNQLLHEVTAAFYGVLQAREMAQVQADQVRSIAESLRVARSRLESGAAVRADVLSLETRLAQAQEDLIRAQNGVRLAVAALNMVLGRDLVRDAEDLLPPDRSPDLSACDVEERCIDEHPAYRAALHGAAARRAAWLAARANRRPKLNLFGSRDWDSGDGSDYESSYLVGVMAEWELWDGGMSRAAAMEAKAEYEAATAEARKLRDQLLLDLRQAALRAREAAERLQVAERAAETAEEALRLTKSRYEQGAAELAELLHAEVAFAAARARRVAAEYDLRTAISNVERARGRWADWLGEP